MDHLPFHTMTQHAVTTLSQTMLSLSPTTGAGLFALGGVLLGAAISSLVAWHQRRWEHRLRHEENILDAVSALMGEQLAVMQLRGYQGSARTS